MDGSELDPLDQLLSAINESDNTGKQVKNKEITDLNEDEFFLSKIAAHDLKAIKPPRRDTKSKLNISAPSTSNCKQSSQEPKNGKSSKLNLSLIHSGDTDSSDDEDNKDYQNNKYNESGRGIKHLLPVEKSKSELANDISWKKKRTAPSNSLSAAITPSKFGLNVVNKDVITEPFFGIRISKPLISNTVLQERMEGRVAVSMSRVKNFVATIIPNQDWVIAGAIVQKSNVRTSQKGYQYIILTLSDLQNDLQTVALFLFRSAYKELWKTAVGTVIGVLNPSILDNKEGTKQQATLSVDNHQKVMIFGQSKDYGLCKSKRKDGEQCTNFVNTNRCTFCLYHVKQEYQKLSLRSDLQSKYSGGGLTALRNKVLGKNEVFYAGKSYTAIPAKKSKRLTEKDNLTLRMLNNKGVVTSSSTPAMKKKGFASSFDVSRNQRMKDLQKLQRLNCSADISFGLDSKINFDRETVSAEVSLEDSKKTALNIIAKLKTKTDNKMEKSFDKNEKSSDLSTEQSKKTDFDIISKLRAKNSDEATDSSYILEENNSEKLFQEEFSNETSKTYKTSSSEPKLTQLNKDTLVEPSTSKINSARQTSQPKSSNHEKENKTITDITTNLNSEPTLSKNLEYKPKLTHNGSFMVDLNKPVNKKLNRAKLNALQWVQKNGPIKKDNPVGTQKSGVKRFLENQSENEPKEKKSKLEEHAKVSQRFRKIMEMTSKHADLLEQRDLEEQEKYFNKLEIREKMEEKMMSTYKVQCKAVKCLQCKYTSFSAADRCKKEKHPLKVFDAMKRFFKCGNCGNRTVSLEICPLFSCKQCGGSKWERTAMMKEKKVHVGEALSIRGGEQKFVNSVVSNANINLLMPDE